MSDLENAPWIQSEALPDAPFDVPEEDGLAKFGKQATEVAEAAVGPGIQFITQLPALAAGGIQGIGELVRSGGDVEKAVKASENMVEAVPKYEPSTALGKELGEGFSWMLGKEIPEGALDLYHKFQNAFSKSPGMLTNLPSEKVNAALETSVEQGALLTGMAAPFKAARRMAPKRRAVTEEQLRQALEDQSRTSPPDAPFATPEFRESPMPLKPGEQGQLFPEPLRGPEGPQGELFPRMARSAEELRIDETTRQPLQETIEPPRPPASPLLELQPKDTVDLAKLAESKQEEIRLLEQEKAAYLRQGDSVGAERTRMEIESRIASKEMESIEFSLRQEELLKLRANYERWIKQAEEQGDFKLVEDLKKQFDSELPDYGVRTSSEAVGTQPLYEQGVGTRLPIESSQRPLLGAPKDWNPYAPGADLKTLRIGGRFSKQAGNIDFNFRKGEGKKIPIEDRIRIAGTQFNDIMREIDNLSFNKRNATNELDVKRLEKEINFLKDESEKAKELVQSLTNITEQPKAAILPLGQTKFGESQRGSFGFKQDPEFKQFKNNLRDTLKPYAAELWKEINKKQLKPTVIEHQSEREAIANIPGLSDALKYIEPIFNKTTEEVLTLAKSEPDINLTAAGRGLAPGMQLTGVWKKSTLLHYVGQLVNRGKVVANAAKYDHLLNKDTGLKSMIDQLQGAKNVWRALMENEGIKDLTAADYSKYNLTPKEVVAAKKFREVFDTIHNTLDQTRKLLFGPNTATLHRRAGYIPGIFGGDFQGMIWRRHVNPTTGEVTLEALSRYGADTRWEANARKAYYEDHFKELGDKLVIGPVEHRPLKALELRDSNIVFNELAELVGKDDPMFQMIQELQERVLAGKAYDYSGVRKHFEPKKNEGILGAKGFEPDLSAEKNAQNGFQASLRYAEQAFDWVEMQKVGMEMKKIIGDEELKISHPNTFKYIDLYWKTISKQGTNTSRAIDSLSRDVANLTGVGVSNIRDATRTIKSFLTISYLTTPVFGGVQLMQPIQMGIPWMGYLVGKGAKGNPVYATSMASVDMMQKISKGRMSESGTEAMKWAEDNHILDSHILDDVRPETLQKMLGGVRELSGLPLRKLEEYTRRYSYLMWSHFLENSGMERGPHLYETASNLTNMVMTDYRLHERPLVYQQLGVIGEGMSTLTAFKHNNYTQMFTAVGTEKIKPGNDPYRLLMKTSLLGSIALFSGTMGLHFREDIDNFIHALNDYGPLEKPLPTLAGFMIKNQPDWLTFGGVSSLSGMDLSSRFGSAKAFPSGGIDSLFPYTSDVIKHGTTAWDMARNPSKDTALAAAHNWSPNAFKFMSEEAAQKGTMAVNPETHKGIIERDKKDLMARRFGGRSLREAKEMIANRDATMESTSIKGRQSAIIKKAAQNPNSDKRAEWMEKYVKLDNNPATAPARFIAAIKEYESNMVKSQRTRILETGGPAATRRLEYDK